MIKLVLAVVAFVYLFLTAYSVNEIEVAIQLLPLEPARTLSLGILLPFFFAIGMIVTILIGLSEWLRMRNENDKLKRQLKGLGEEVVSLRNMMVMDSQEQQAE